MFPESLPPYIVQCILYILYVRVKKSRRAGEVVGRGCGEKRGEEGRRGEGGLGGTWTWVCLSECTDRQRGRGEVDIVTLFLPFIDVM